MGCVWLIAVWLVLVPSVTLAADPVVVAAADSEVLGVWIDGGLKGILAAVVGWAVTVAFRYVKSQAARAALEAAVRAAAGLAYDFLQSYMGSKGGQELKQLAVEHGAGHVATMVAPALKQLGHNSDDVRRLVAGELGRLLAVDPTTAVSWGPSSVDSSSTPAAAGDGTGKPAETAQAPDQDLGTLLITNLIKRALTPETPAKAS